MWAARDKRTAQRRTGEHCSSGTKPDGSGETPPRRQPPTRQPPSAGQTAAPAYLALIGALTSQTAALSTAERDFSFEVKAEPSPLPMFQVNAGGGHSPCFLVGQAA